METYFVITYRAKRGMLFLQCEEPYNAMDVFYGSAKFSQPLKMRIAKGTRNSPYAFFPDPRNIAHAEAVVHFMEQSLVTGFRTFPLEIRECSWKYFGMQCTGRCGPIIRPKETGYVRGLNFDVRQWNGADLFVATDMGFKFCTEKFRDQIVKAGFFSKEDFIPMEEFRWYNAG